MKRTFLLLSLSTVVVTPAISHAQSTGILTRQEVKGEIAQLRAAGYSQDTDGSYPMQLIAAEQRINAAETKQDRRKR